MFLACSGGFGGGGPCYVQQSMLYGHSYLFVSFETGTHSLALAVMNSLCRAGFSQIHRAPPASASRVLILTFLIIGSFKMVPWKWLSMLDTTSYHQ